MTCRKARAAASMMSVETDKRLSDSAIAYLESLPYVHWLRALPEVMRHEPEEELAIEGSEAGLASGGELA